ncbi:hypothetical protein [Pontivivens ytuae]|uniref:DUF1579 domain-containing protein n=1 Tax=Pontivivens ytuae TaxID=2789856 RepID=A0A7S9LVF5_9RHOB|nr:hypothetical protein [Pontivivens ytuae]QPH55705.1 hypothetical protein I0K15_08260 [Pontivivens ytuae]
MSGRWSGAYEYFDPERPPAPFCATLVEEGGVVAGRVEEPNGFYLGGPDQLHARLHGERDGNVICFSKTYEVDGLIFRLVHYRGEADATLSRIEGRWWILGPGGSSGTFEMARVADTLDTSSSRSAGAT